MVVLVESWVEDCESSPKDWLASAMLEYAPTPVLRFVQELTAKTITDCPIMLIGAISFCGCTGLQTRLRSSSPAPANKPLLRNSCMFPCSFPRYNPRGVIRL